MSVTLIEVLRKKRAASTIRSMATSEAYERLVHNKAEAAREQLGNTSGLDENKEFIAQLAHHYYTMKAKYSGKALNTKVVESEKRQEFWGKVSEACKKARVSPERYMKAQFHYFHTVFGTTPKLSQLATEAAIDRATMYTGKTSGRVVSNAIEHNTNLGAVFSRCEQQIRDVCRAQNVSREEYYTKFVLTGLIAMPKKFLDADPVFKRVSNGVGR